MTSTFRTAPAFDDPGLAAADAATLVDAVERRELERRRDALETVIQEMPAGVLVVEVPGGRVLMSNHLADAYLATPLTGSGSELDYLGKHADDRPYQPEEFPLVRAMAGETVAGEDIDFVLGDGRRVTLRASAAPVHERDGTVTAAVLVLTDVTAHRRRERHLAAQHAVSRELAQAASLADAGPAVLRGLVEALDVDVGALWYTDDHQQLLRCVDVWQVPGLDAAEFLAATRSRTFTPGDGLPGRVWANNESAWIPDVVEDDNFPRAAVAAKCGLHFGFGVPIRLGSEVLGVLEFFGRRPLAPDKEVLALVAAVGHQIGQFAERCRGADELLHAFEARDHVARVLQTVLRPAALPAIAGVDIAARYRPATDDVCGDFYDLFRLRGRQWGLAIGDVCGRGVEAAALTATARYTMRTAALLHRRPAEVLGALNEVLLGTDTDRFCTAVFARVERVLGQLRLTVASGGHPPAVVLRGGAVERLSNTGMLLGVATDVALTDEEVRLDPGDAIVFYTDGLTEARTADGSLFGDDGLMELAQACCGLDAEAIAARLYEQATANDAGHADDLAIVVLVAR